MTPPRVLALYRCDLAPGIDLDEVEVERAHLRRRVIQVLARGAHRVQAYEAEAMLERVLELDRLDEAVLQQLLARLSQPTVAFLGFRPFGARKSLIANG